MIINISIEVPETKEVYPTAEKIHNSLKGNPDYVNSNIVLNYNAIGYSIYQSVRLVINTKECYDKKLALDKAKEAIDLLY